MNYANGSYNFLNIAMQWANAANFNQKSFFKFTRCIWEIEFIFNNIGGELILARFSLKFIAQIQKNIKARYKNLKNGQEENGSSTAVKKKTFISIIILSCHKSNCKLPLIYVNFTSLPRIQLQFIEKKFDCERKKQRESKKFSSLIINCIFICIQFEYWVANEVMWERKTALWVILMDKFGSTHESIYGRFIKNS